MDRISPSRFCPDNLFAHEQNSQAIMWDSEHVCLPIGRPAGHNMRIFKRDKTFTAMLTSGRAGIITTTPNLNLPATALHGTSSI